MGHFVDNDGTVWTITEKGFIAFTLMQMVPGLDMDTAERLTRQLIEDAVDAVELLP